MKNKIIIAISILVIIGTLGIVFLFLGNDEQKISYTEDEIKFKDEYENLNGQELFENYTLKTVDINIDNNVKYVTDEEILNLLTKGNNVIYLGWADCNWCRSIVPTLVEALKERHIDTLYYYDFKNLRNNYENDSSEEKVKLYKDIIEIIGDDIESVFDENSPRSGEKKILAPTVIFIKNGQYIGLHVKSVDSQIKSTDELSDEEKKELKDIYIGYIAESNAVTCDDEGC